MIKGLNEALGKLYIIPTPIGNLEDITLRAIRILKEVDVILAEDTRTSLKLLKAHNIQTTLQSFHQHNEHAKVDKFTHLLLQGKIIAQISDAGTPGISDPGYLLVKNCIENHIPFECLPGACALIPALLLSGFSNHEFLFVGFLPIKKGRLTKLKELTEIKKTQIIYESPHKINKTITQIIEYFGEDIPITISRELTKIYEETLRGTASEILDQITKKTIKGEIVIVINNGLK